MNARTNTNIQERLILAAWDPFYNIRCKLCLHLGTTNVELKNCENFKLTKLQGIDVWKQFSEIRAFYFSSWHHLLKVQWRSGSMRCRPDLRLNRTRKNSTEMKSNLREILFRTEDWIATLKTGERPQMKITPSNCVSAHWRLNLLDNWKSLFFLSGPSASTLSIITVYSQEQQSSFTLSRDVQ